MSTQVFNTKFSNESSSDGWDEMYNDHLKYEEELEKAQRGK